MKILILFCTLASFTAFADDIFTPLLNDPAALEALTTTYLSGERPKPFPSDQNPALALHRAVRAITADPAPNSVRVLQAYGRLNAFALRASALESRRRNQAWRRFPPVHEDSSRYSADLAALLKVDDGRLLPRGLLALQTVARTADAPEVRAAAKAAIQASIDVLRQIAERTGEFARPSALIGKEQAVAARMIRQLGGGRNDDLRWFTLDSDQAVGAAIRAYFVRERPPGARDDDNPALRMYQFLDEHAAGTDAAAHRAGELLSRWGLLFNFAIRNEMRGTTDYEGAADLQFVIEGIAPGQLSVPLINLARLAREGGTSQIQWRAELATFEIAYFVIKMAEDVPSNPDWLRLATDLIQAAGTKNARHTLQTLSATETGSLGAAARATLAASCDLLMRSQPDAALEP